VDSDHFWRALSLLWVAGASVNLWRDLEPSTVLKFAAPAAGRMIQIVRNGRAVVFGVARAQPGRANIFNCRESRSGSTFQRGLQVGVALSD
jgi:hypothetical protein